MMMQGKSLVRESEGKNGEGENVGILRRRLFVGCDCMQQTLTTATEHCEHVMRQNVSHRIFSGSENVPLQT